MDPPSSHHRASAALRRATIFRTLDDDALPALSSLAERRPYRAGTTVTEHDPSTPSVFVIATGDIRLARSSPAGDEFTLLDRHAGDTFAFLSRDRDGCPTTVAHVLDGGAIVYELPRARLYHLLTLYPDTLLDLINLWGSLAAFGFDRCAELALCKVQARLAHELLRRAGEGADLVATRCELAGWIATSPAEVMRGLATFRDQGWIAFAPRSPRIVVLRADALARL